MTTTTRERVRNIGISAHIDSGKTTLTERILFYTGRIYAIHDVKGKDGVGATMDSMDLEREKGITIQSAATYCDWKDHAINIIDTPGHVDFTIEVERALRVLDGAVLVLCAVGGVQSQSVTVDRQMRRYGVPCLAFVNKCDRAGADPLGVAEQLREQLGHNAVMIQHPIGLEGEHRGVVDLITREAYTFGGEKGEDVEVGEVPAELVEVVEAQRAKLIEALADIDDCLAMRYLEGEDIEAEAIYPVLRAATIARKVTPVCLGSAFKNKGVQPLLDAVVRFLPSPLDRSYAALDVANDEAEVALSGDPADPLVMLAFKLEDGQYGQLTYCRIYQGTLRKGDFIHNTATKKKVKVGRLVQMHADEMHDIESAQAGDIVALFGVDCASGDTFTDGRSVLTMTSMHVPEPVVTLAVAPTKKQYQANFSKALNRFSKEDPTFRVRHDPESGETIIGGMGELHLEVYIERMRREYRVAVQVGAPQVAYRETITRRAEFDYTHKKQTGGAGQYGRVAGYIEPLELDGDGERHYEFVDEIKGGVIPTEFLPSCDKGFRAALAEGQLIGFPVVGVRVVLNDGKSHAVDSSDRAFQTASRFAFRQAYPKAKPVILEPVMKVEVEGPESFSGAMLSSLNKRRGMILGNTNTGSEVRVQALVPLAEMFGYSNDLRSATQGKATFSMEFSSYAPVPAAVQEELVRRAQQEAKKAKGA
ncbi:MAG: elongation factor G [Planctomycetota bacterium]|nr:MAG: elongation factor G [Planctomycetota bacterium]